MQDAEGKKINQRRCYSYGVRTKERKKEK